MIEATTKPRNLRELRVYGIKRSGNHAIIRWLMNAHTGSIVHCNNIKGTDPFADFGQLETRRVPYQFCKNDPLGRLKHGLKGLFRKDDRIVVSRRDAKGTPETVRNHPDRALLILSYENQSLQAPMHAEFAARHDDLVGVSEECWRVLVLRDPANLFASMIRSNRLTSTNLTHIQDLWIELAQAVVDLRGTNPQDSNQLAILYNDWVRDGSYRANILQRLNLSSNTSVLEDVPRYGAGSSFQGTSVKASQLDVFDRWKHYSDEPFFRHTLAPQAIRELGCEIFGDEMREVFEMLGMPNG